MTAAKKINLTILLSAILIIVFAVFIIASLLKEIKKNSAVLLTQKENLASLDAEIQNLDQLKVSYNKASPDIEKMENLFVSAEMPVEFISFLEKSAQDSGIKIKISSSSFTAGKGAEWPFLNFQITVTGSFSQLLSFLKKIENAPYLLEIKNLNINQLKGEKQTEANLSLKVYAK